MIGLDNLDPDVHAVLLAALAAMVIDSHACQDQLTAAQWGLAGRMFARLNARVAPGEMGEAT